VTLELEVEQARRFKMAAEIQLEDLKERESEVNEQRERASR
jgi:hypothetical protein